MHNAHLFGRFGLFIDHRIGEFGERFVGVLFLGKGRIEELDGIVEAELSAQRFSVP